MKRIYGKEKVWSKRVTLIQERERERERDRERERESLLSHSAKDHRMEKRSETDTISGISGSPFPLSPLFLSLSPYFSLSLSFLNFFSQKQTRNRFFHLPSISLSLFTLNRSLVTNYTSQDLRQFTFTYLF